MTTIKLDAADRQAVLGSRKTAHLYPVRRSLEPPFEPGTLHALWREIPDPLERDPLTGKLKNVNDDGTPKEAKDTLHVEIVSVVETPLADLVKADAQAMNFSGLANLARWWLDQRNPAWRQPGDYVSADIALEEFRRRWHHRTAWLVTWKVATPDKTVFLKRKGGYTTNPSPSVALLDAGAVLLTKAQINAKAETIRLRELAAGEKERKKRADDAAKLAAQYRNLYTGKDVTSGMARAARSRHRHIAHLMAQGAQDLVRIAS